jgi:hypothetical protein
MIRDARTTFCTATNVYAAAGTAVFGNYIDRTTTPNFDQAKLYLQVWCTTTFVGVATGTVQFDMISSAATSGSTPNIHISSPLFPQAVSSVAPLSAGSPIMIQELPRGSGILGAAAYLRYIMMQCVTATETTTAGAVAAFLSLEAGYWAALPNASQ